MGTDDGRFIVDFTSNLRRVATFAYVGIFSLLDGGEVIAGCGTSADAWELLDRRTAASACSASEADIKVPPVSADVVRLDDPFPWMEDSLTSGVFNLVSTKRRGPLLRLFV